MCSQGQSAVKHYLPLLADRPSIAQVTITGQVCASTNESVKSSANQRHNVHCKEVCVCVSACARPAVWHSAVSGAQPRPNVQAQAS